MLSIELISLLKWYCLFFLIGIAFLPLSRVFFGRFWDKGYIFAKIIGASFISYLIFVLGTVKLLSFTWENVLIFTLFLCLAFFISPYFLERFRVPKNFWKENFKRFLLLEFVFSVAFFFWIYVRGHNPDIFGIEKFMDLAFINSILRSTSFPSPDPWFSPASINYYYFGHLLTAVLIKISQVPSSIGFNLMLSSIFALIFTQTFSIATTFLKEAKVGKYLIILGGFFCAFFLTFTGNLTTVYTLFESGTGSSSLPFWTLNFSPDTYPNSYWYATATRFISNSIHEIPSYALSLSDLHAHLLNTPLAIASLALSISFFIEAIGEKSVKALRNKTLLFSFLMGFVLSLEYMTNAWDAIIYFILFIFLVFYVLLSSKNAVKEKASLLLGAGAITAGSAFLFSLPFSLFFQPFVSGIGIVCSPKLLTDIGRLGPFIFEEGYCQKSPVWQVLLLYGFFLFTFISFYLLVLRNSLRNNYNILATLLFLFGGLLVILPEIIYLKDIYPLHFRANTMFKTAYQAFIIFSISGSFMLIKIFQQISFKRFPLNALFLFFFVPLLILVSIYPFFSLPASHRGLREYVGLDGMAYLKDKDRSDFEAINWLNKNISGQPGILEALGDSYSEKGRVSVYTGLPTILEWTAHQWLWRGTYEIAAPRVKAVGEAYESQDVLLTKKILSDYKISYVYIGEIERKTYKGLYEKKFEQIGNLIYQKGSVKIYKVN